MFSGVFTTLVTPFLGTQIDEDGLTELAQWQVAEGAAGLVIGSIAGEGPTLLPTERHRLTRIAVEAAAGRAPVFATTGTNCTASSIELTRAARSAGAWAAILVAPYYNKPTQEGVYSHIEAVARAVDIPLLVHNCPARTGYDIAPETLERLAGLDSVMGVVDEAADPDRLMAGAVRPMALFLPRETARLPLHAEATGVFSLAANVAPALCREAWKRRLTGDRSGVARLDALYRAFDLAPEPVAAKYAVSLLWPTLDPAPRLPLTPAGGGAEAAVRVAMAGLASALPAALGQERLSA